MNTVRVVLAVLGYVAMGFAVAVATMRLSRHWGWNWHDDVEEGFTAVIVIFWPAWIVMGTFTWAIAKMNALAKRWSGQ